MTVHESNQSLFENQTATVVFAHWHGHEMAILPLLRPFKIATLISQSRDGDLMNYVVEKMGGKTSRGSSSRGAISGLKGLIKLCQSGRNASMAVDGPKGPIYKVKPGVFELSRLLDAPIVPMGIAARSSYVFKRSWNQAMLPLPFTRVQVYFGDHLSPVTKGSSAKDLKLSEGLENALNGAVERAKIDISF